MKRTEKSFVVCINNKGYPASLEIRKLYQAIPDERAAKVLGFALVTSREKITSILPSTLPRFGCRTQRKRLF
jgi:hypothetical protein